MPTPFDPHGGPSDDRWRAALQVTRAAIAIVDAQGRWLELNPAFERLVGREAAALHGHPVFDCLLQSSCAAMQRQLDAAMASEEGVEAEQHWLRQGLVLATPIHAVALRDAHGAVQAVMLEHVVPNTNRDRHPLQLFADAIAHDLRAPLRSIDSFAQLLGKRAAARLDDTDRDHLGRIRNAAARMGGLLVALSELSLAMRAELRTAVVDLSLLAEWVIAELREAHAADEAIEARVQVQPGLRAQGDERLLKLMLAQVLGNAWKFSRGCGGIDIRVEGECDDGLMRLRIHDRGCGFDMQYAHKLFQPFQRLHGPDQGGGHGLGLAIAQCIAQRHGGHIHAQSQPQAGSVFTIELPAAPAAESAPHA